MRISPGSSSLNLPHLTSMGFMAVPPSKDHPWGCIPQGCFAFQGETFVPLGCALTSVPPLKEAWLVSHEFAGAGTNGGGAGFSEAAGEVGEARVLWGEVVEGL